MYTHAVHSALSNRVVSDNNYRRVGRQVSDYSDGNVVDVENVRWCEVGHVESLLGCEVEVASDRRRFNVVEVLDQIIDAVVEFVIS